MKSDYRFRAEKFIKSILPYIENVMYSDEDVEMAVEAYNKDKNRTVLFEMGSARFVLITSDYAVKWDYDADDAHEIGGCVDEYNAYVKAKEDGYDYLLAEISLITVNGHLFGIMPRIKKIGRQYHSGDIRDYVTRKEFNWLSNFGTDFHSYNWGLRNGKACLVDYAFSKEVIKRRNEE